MKSNKLFSSILTIAALGLSLLTTPAHAEASFAVTLRDPLNTDVPEYGTNPHFTRAPDGKRVIYFDVRVINTGTSDETITQIVGELRNAEGTLLDTYTRPGVNYVIKPGELKVFTKYSAQPFQLFKTEGIPDGVYYLSVTVEDTRYTETVRFDNQDLYFITDSNTPAPSGTLKSLEARVTALESQTKKIKAAGKTIADAR